MPDKYSSLFESYLAEESFTGSAPELYEPIKYIMSLGGKRIRPLAVLMGHGVFNKEVSLALPAALAVELFHNFTLMHDDIMDNAPLRRGKATVHTKYDANAAILSGDAMFALSYRVLGRLSPAVLPQALHLFTETAIGVCEGQQMDMAFETETAVPLENYIEMIRLKTAILPACCFKLGGIAAGASAQDSDLLYEFGLNLGIAFQIKDDYLDTFGDAEQVGKKAGGDIVQNKKTYLFLAALEAATPDQRKILLALYGSTTIDESDKVKQVIELFEEIGVPTLTEQAVSKWTEKALQCLEKLPVSAENILPLRHFAAGLMNRTL